MRRRLVYSVPLFVAATSAFFSGCSTLKNSSLRDPRVLHPGQMEIAGELSTAASVQDNTLKLAMKENPSVKAAIDSSAYDYREGSLPLLWGGYFSKGLKNGYQFDAGLNFAMFPLGALLIDLGVKKRLYTSEHFVFGAYGRLGLGTASNTLDLSTPSQVKVDDHQIFHLDSRTAEVDVTSLNLWKPFRRLYFYVNVGVNTAFLGYTLENRSSDGLPKQRDAVVAYGIKNDAGVILDLSAVDLIAEYGAHFLNYGYVPSVGLRVAYHLPGAKD